MKTDEDEIAVESFHARPDFKDFEQKVLTCVKRAGKRGASLRQLKERLGLIKDGRDVPGKVLWLLDALERLDYARQIHANFNPACEFKPVTRYMFGEKPKEGARAVVSTWNAPISPKSEFTELRG